MPFEFLLVITLLISSWLLIYLTDKKHIFSHWLLPPSKRVNEFLLGFSLMAGLCLLTKLIQTLMGGISWNISADLTLIGFLSSVFGDVNSVFIEELIFRGALLYLLIKYLGVRTAIIISSAAFGMYHWWSYGVFGNWFAMLLVFLTTAFMGYVFAKAYVKTDSIMLPVGLHLGWNLINNTFFAGGQRGAVVFAPDHTPELTGFPALVLFVWYLGVAVMVLYVIHKWFPKRSNA